MKVQPQNLFSSIIRNFFPGSPYFCHEDGGSTFYGTYLPDYTASLPRKQHVLHSLCESLRFHIILDNLQRKNHQNYTTYLFTHFRSFLKHIIDGRVEGSIEVMGRRGGP